MTTQAPIDPRKTSSAAPKVQRVEVYWHTVTYKTVAIYLIIIVLLILGGIYVFDADLYSRAYARINKAVGNGDSENLPISATQAKFVNLDGKVQIKKVNSVQWVDADFRSTLDKGDLIQTGPDGLARVNFADGTIYTVKPDTLITVEENAMGNNKPTSVAIRISTGEVNLATPNWSVPDSKAAVSVEDAKAEIHPNSRANVKADPQNKESEIVVSSGSAEVQRGQEKIELGSWERASIPTNGTIQKSTVLAPPDLSEPRNLEPVIVDNPKTASVHFEWKPVAEAVSYTIRVSSTAMFTKILKEARVTNPSAEISGLDAGDYFWNVIAMDAKKQTSDVSETFKFTLVAQGKAQGMALDISGTQLHGRVVEVFGHAEPGAALIINGQPVPNIQPDGSFRYFTEPLDPGEHTIVVLGSNRRGGTAQRQVSIVVPR